MQSKGSSDICISASPPSKDAAVTFGISVLYKAAFTAIPTASKRFPPHCNICEHIQIFSYELQM